MFLGDEGVTVSADLALAEAPCSVLLTTICIQRPGAIPTRRCRQRAHSPLPILVAPD